MPTSLERLTDQRWLPVESSHIAAIAYDEASEHLHVEFKSGAVYSYEHVTLALWIDLFQTRVSKGSIGHWLSVNIKAHADLYPFTRVRPPAPRAPKEPKP